MEISGMSTIKVDAIQNTSGVEVYTAKAWVNFNGTGTVAINADGNVSSITDNGTGLTQITFANTTSSANYTTTASASKHDTNNDGNMHCHCNGYNNGASNPNTTSNSHLVTCFTTTSAARDCGVVTFMLAQ